MGALLVLLIFAEFLAGLIQYFDEYQGMKIFDGSTATADYRSAMEEELSTSWRQGVFFSIARTGIFLKTHCLLHCWHCIGLLQKSKLKHFSTN
ncbi:hypothetical protein SAMN05444008_10970 [Cnuella takakiae]|uniref:Uncharacterized protein n=1 Tax=Cnuella takakiae TaxID=1302690 RepID=A0A1M5CGX3_9BACT|nr:hypothetical protein [Cnuella takakiae]OLY91820.1 hypothetical protein BUE76_07845 [Cnuella takakiae]SHF54005.1 hypothetical protein SAMN05444008_10970 [Cnuella takakiae]